MILFYSILAYVIVGFLTYYITKMFRLCSSPTIAAIFWPIALSGALIIFISMLIICIFAKLLETIVELCGGSNDSESDCD